MTKIGFSVSFLKQVEFKKGGGKYKQIKNGEWRCLTLVRGIRLSMSH